MRHVVGKVVDLPPGSVRIVPVGNPQGIGVFNVGGTYYALKNVCPHQGGPLCRGPITGTTRSVEIEGEAPGLQWDREGEIVRCPWHRWEFEIATGRTVFDSRFRVSTYDVHSAGLVDDDVPTVETYPVRVEEQYVILELT
jgi:nitrite reductase (NADH) small subunit